MKKKANERLSKRMASLVYLTVLIALGLFSVYLVDPGIASVVDSTLTPQAYLPVVANDYPRPTPIPFVLPIYHQSDLDAMGITLDVTEVHQDHETNTFDFYAQDHCNDVCGPGGGGGEGLPIYLPGDIRVLMVYSVRGDDDPEATANLNMYIEHKDTGVVFFMTHVRPGPLLEELASRLGASNLQHFGSRWPPSDEYLIPLTPENENVPFATWGYAGEEHETPINHLHIEAQYAFPDDPYFNEFIGYNQEKRYNKDDQIGLCPDGDAQHPNGYGPCPDLGILNFNLTTRLVTGGWVDPSK